MHFVTWPCKFRTILKIPEMRGEEFLSAEVHGNLELTRSRLQRSIGVSTSEESHADFLIDFALDASS